MPLLAALWLACAADPCDRPTVEVGTGADAFTPVTEGDAIPIIFGPQGGWHLWGAFRDTGLDPVVTVSYTIRRAADDAPLSDSLFTVATVRDGECAGTFAGLQGVLTLEHVDHAPEDNPETLLDGVEVVLRIALEDVAGLTAADEVTLVAEAQPR